METCKLMDRYLYSRCLFMLIVCMCVCVSACKWEYLRSCKDRDTFSLSNLLISRDTVLPSCSYFFFFVTRRAGMAFTNSANDFQRSALDKSDEAFNSVSDGFLNYTKEVFKVIY